MNDSVHGELREFLKATNTSFVVSAGIIGMVVGKITEAILFKTLGLSIAMILSGSILTVIENLLLAISLATILYVSIIIIKSRGPSGKRIAITAFFILFAMVRIAFDYKVIYGFAVATENLDSFAAKEKETVDKKLEKTTNNESITKLSYLKAEHAYVYEDRIETYLDKDGTERKFLPNQEAINYKKSHVLWQATSKYTTVAMTVNIVITILSTLAAIYVGLSRKFPNSLPLKE